MTHDTDHPDLIATLQLRLLRGEDHLSVDELVELLSGDAWAATQTAALPGEAGEALRLALDVTRGPERDAEVPRAPQGSRSRGFAPHDWPIIALAWRAVQGAGAEVDALALGEGPLPHAGLQAQQRPALHLLRRVPRSITLAVIGQLAGPPLRRPDLLGLASLLSVSAAQEALMSTLPVTARDRAWATLRRELLASGQRHEEAWSGAPHVITPNLSPQRLAALTIRTGRLNPLGDWVDAQPQSPIISDHTWVDDPRGTLSVLIALDGLQAADEDLSRQSPLDGAQHLRLPRVHDRALHDHSALWPLLNLYLSCQLNLTALLGVNPASRFQDLPRDDQLSLRAARRISDWLKRHPDHGAPLRTQTRAGLARLSALCPDLD